MVDKSRQFLNIFGSIFTTPRIEAFLAEGKELKKSKMKKLLKLQECSSKIRVVKQRLMLGKMPTLILVIKQEPAITNAPDLRLNLNCLTNTKLLNIRMFSWKRFGHVDITGFTVWRKAIKMLKMMPK